MDSGQSSLLDDQFVVMVGYSFKRMKLIDIVSVSFDANVTDEQYSCAHYHPRDILRRYIGTWPLENTRPSAKTTRKNPAS